MEPFDGCFLWNEPQWCLSEQPSWGQAMARTQVRCSSWRQTPGILKSPSVSFWPVWISAGNSLRENRCDCTVILMSFVERPHSKYNPKRKEQKKEAALTSRLLKEGSNEVKFYKLQTHCIFCITHRRHWCKLFIFFNGCMKMWRYCRVTAHIKSEWRTGNRHRQIEVLAGIFTDPSFRQACH